MGEQTKIAWTDATFNPWIGCTKVHLGCKHCFAEKDNNFHKWNGGTWGPGAPRKVTSPSNWKKPLAWARSAAKVYERRKVFCGSLCDVLDEEAPPEAQARLWDLIRATAACDSASIGYDDAHARSAQRNEGSRVGPGWGIGDRSRGENLEDRQAHGQPLDSGIACDSMQTCARGVRERRGLLAGSGDDRWRSVLRGSASSDLAACERTDSGWDDYQPHQRGQGGQQTGESRTGDLLPSESARDPRVGCAAPRRERRAEPQGSGDEGRSVGDAATAGGRREDQDHRRTFRHDTEGGIGDLPPQNLVTHRVIPDGNPGGLTWLILTKRPERWAIIPADVRPLVWLGTSASDQPTWDEWVGRLAKAEGFARLFVSLEPMVGPVDGYKLLGYCHHCDKEGVIIHADGTHARCERPVISWVIIGGESGPKARPCDVAWIRSFVAQCREAGVAPFVKQLGARPVQSMAAALSHLRGADASQAVGYLPGASREALRPLDLGLLDSHGGNPDEWPADLRIREFPEVRHG